MDGGEVADARDDIRLVAAGDQRLRLPEIAVEVAEGEELHPADRIRRTSRAARYSPHRGTFAG